MTKKHIKDIQYLIGGSGVIITLLLCVMFFSPLSTQHVDGISRGNHWQLQVDVLYKNFSNNDSIEIERALCVVDSLIDVKEEKLLPIAYFDRFLTENDRFAAANNRADIYDLQWIRIEILQRMNDIDLLQDALKEYSKVIGYNQAAAKEMYQQLNANRHEEN